MGRASSARCRLRTCCRRRARADAARPPVLATPTAGVKVLLADGAEKPQCVRVRVRVRVRLLCVRSHLFERVLCVCGWVPASVYGGGRGLSICACDCEYDVCLCACAVCVCTCVCALACAACAGGESPWSPRWFDPVLTLHDSSTTLTSFAHRRCRTAKCGVTVNARPTKICTP